MNCFPLSAARKLENRLKQQGRGSGFINHWSAENRLIIRQRPDRGFNSRPRNQFSTRKLGLPPQLQSCLLFLVIAKKTPARDGAKILVGTASWSDPGFVERWYPKGMRAADRLPWYADHFEIVEVNSTFYSVPDPRMVERWCRATPDQFIFDVKLHRLLSRHSTPLKMLPQNLQSRADPDSKGKVKLTSKIEELVIDCFMQSIEPLRAAGKLGALLLQLSPAFSPKTNRLAELDALLDPLRRVQHGGGISESQLGDRRSTHENRCLPPETSSDDGIGRCSRASALYHYAERIG